MDKYVISDDFLYKHMKNVEEIILDNLPKEEELSHKFSKRFERKMNKLIKQEKRSPFMNSFISYGKKVAIIFLISLSIIFTTTMSIEAYRIRVFEGVTRIWREFTSIIFKSEEDISGYKLISVIPKYIPKGFSVYEKNVNDNICSVIYRNIDNEEIFYEQRLISHGELLLDTENIKIETIELDNQTVILFTNKGVNQLYWSDDSYTYTLISSINIEELVKIIKSIFENNKNILK